MLKELGEHLKHSVATVTFTKANGQTRTMDCTLAAYLLPETTQESNHTKGDTMIVFSLDEAGWRSFRLDRVTDYELL